MIGVYTPYAASTPMWSSSQMAVLSTADRARARGVRVIELAEASKVCALNAGDRACSATFRRVYLDADIRVSSDDLVKVADYLAGEKEACVCAPPIQFDFTRSSYLVKQFYRAYSLLPYIRSQMIGSGFYAVNAAGRARWESFPDLTADDLFVQGCFQQDERMVLGDAHFVVVAPRSLRGLLRVRTRTYRGNREVMTAHVAGSMTGSRQGSVSAAKTLVRDQLRLQLPFCVYFGVNAFATLRAHVGRRGSWLTGTSSR